MAPVAPGAITSTCNSHSVGSSVENSVLNVNDTGQPPVVHAMSPGPGMIHPCPSTTGPRRPGPKLSGLQPATAGLSPSSTAAKKTDEYFKSRGQKTTTGGWWIVGTKRQAGCTPQLISQLGTLVLATQEAR